MRKPGNIKHPVSAKTGEAALSAKMSKKPGNFKEEMAGPPPARPTRNLGVNGTSGNYSSGKSAGHKFHK